MANPVKILVVDDSATNRLFIRAELERAGYAVTEAEDGDKGLREFMSNPPDLLVMDVIMPEMTGWDVCTRLKNSAEAKNVPIIIMTSRDTEQDMLRSFESGADEFLNKPVDPAELHAAVQKLLAARGKASEKTA